MNEINDLIQDIAKQASTSAIEAVKEQVDLESKEVYDTLQKTTPKSSGNLVNSLKMTKIETNNQYGYKIEYEGNNDKGIPNQLIANALNYGTKTIPAKHFRTRAIRKLKGIDKRIVLRYEQKLKKGE